MTATVETPTFTVPDLSDAGLAALTAELALTAERHDRTGEVPTAGLEAAHRFGALTATVGAQYGGPGLGLVDVARLVAALGEGDPSVALIVTNTLHTHAAQAAAPYWPADAYADLLRRSTLGPSPVNAIRAEPDLGAPARGGLPATIARRTSDGWALSGRKAYATGGPALTHHVVWAVTDEAEPRVGHFVVDAATPGIEWIETWDHLGLRASNTHDVVYTDVVVPADAWAEIPRGDDGVYRDPAVTAGLASFWHTALYLGVARASRAAFADFTQHRVPSALGRPIATTERVQSVAGEIDAQVAQAEAIIFGTLLRAEHGHVEPPARLSLLKVQAARSIVAATQTAVAALGNPGLSRSNPLERHLRDSLCVRVHPPQEDVALVAAGRALLVG